MKAKGIVMQKHDKKRNLYRGDVIELSTEEKAVEAVKDAVKGESAPGETVCWAESIVIDSVTANSKGEKFHGKYSNATYRASGKVVIRTLDAKRDKLKTSTERSFKLEFCDCLDPLNQPDLKVESFELK